MFESFLCLITDNLHAESTCHFDTGVISHKMLLQTVWRNTRGDKIIVMTWESHNSYHSQSSFYFDINLTSSIITLMLIFFQNKANNRKR